MIERTASRELQRFGLVLAGLFLAFGEFIPFVKHHSQPLWPCLVAGSLVAMAAFYPRALRPVRNSWMRLGNILGAVNSFVLLGLLYFLLIVPLAIFFRLRGIDQMNRKFEPELETYRIPRDAQLDRAQLERIF